MGAAGAEGRPGEPLLAVRDLTVVFSAGGAEAAVVDGVSFEVGRGEVVALVGESGSGKTVTGLSLLKLVPEPGRKTAGRVAFEGGDVDDLDGGGLSRLRGGGIGYVFQEPGTALDPVRTIGKELVSVLRRHRGLSRSEAREEAVRWLTRVALPEPERRLSDLPHRMSGGMRQRAMLALALAGGPRLLVADEPTTALDVTIQAQVLDLLVDLQRELGLSVLLITHDLDVVAEVASRALVMYAGEIVEEGSVSVVFDEPAHPYTRGLLAARPSRTTPAGRRRLPAIDGSVPDVGRRPPGCAFAPRCPSAFERCRAERPQETQPPGEGRRVRCFLWDGSSGGGAA